MTTRKLVLLFIAWLFAAGAIAITVAVVLTEVLSWVGIVDRSEATYGLSLNIVTAITFAALASIPFVFRARFTDDGGSGLEPGDPGEDAA
jgi:hypothetical protein